MPETARDSGSNVHAPCPTCNEADGRRFAALAGAFAGLLAWGGLVEPRLVRRALGVADCRLLDRADPDAASSPPRVIADGLRYP